MDKQMFVITNSAGKIIAASHLEVEKEEVKIVLTPSNGQKKFIVWVPEEIANFQNFRNGDEFHKAITKHFEARGTEITEITPLFNSISPYHLNTKLE